MGKIILDGITIEELRLIVTEELNKSIEKILNKKTSTNTPVPISRKEAAKILCVSLPTLDNWTKLGLIPSYRAGNGKGKRYKKEEVLESLKKVKVFENRRNSDKTNIE